MTNQHKMILENLSKTYDEPFEDLAEKLANLSFDEVLAENEEELNAYWIGFFNDYVY